MFDSTVVVAPETVKLPATVTPAEVTVNAVEPSTLTVTVPVPESVTETFELPWLMLDVETAPTAEST